RVRSALYSPGGRAPCRPPAEGGDPPFTPLPRGTRKNRGPLGFPLNAPGGRAPCRPPAEGGDPPFTPLPRGTRRNRGPLGLSLTGRGKASPDIHHGNHTEGSGR